MQNVQNRGEKPLPHLFSLRTCTFYPSTKPLLCSYCLTVTPNKIPVQACNLANIGQLWNPELQHFTLILHFSHTQTSFTTSANGNK